MRLPVYRPTLFQRNDARDFFIQELKNQRELMQQGFALMEKRFEQMDNRFEQSDRRFESLSQRLDRFMLWSFGITFTATALIISAIKLW
jgi:hypothetical protein